MKALFGVDDGPECLVNNRRMECELSSILIFGAHQKEKSLNDDEIFWILQLFFFRLFQVASNRLIAGSFTYT